MTESELHEWLFSTPLREELRQLSLATALLELDNVTPDNSLEDVTFNWPRLLFAASILSRSDKREHKEASLRIATGAMLLSSNDSEKDAAAIVLTKLSNARSAALAERRGRLRTGLETRLGLSLRLEHQRAQLHGSILLETTGERVAVNEFQLAFWSAVMDRHTWVSASAPTASGKTFLVLKWLVDSMGSGAVRSAVYLAPTRALVAEIEAALKEIATVSGIKIEVSSLPSATKYVAAAESSARCVFVFTQERLHLLANQVNENLDIDLLIVDEAHKIGDPQRGVILQDAIERLLRASPKMRVAYVSPATQNPQILLDDAPEATPTRSIDSDAATVLQNIVLARQVPAKPTLWALSLRHGADLAPLGVLQLRSKPNTIRKRLAFIAAAIGQRGGTLVYANGAADAEEIALLISQLVGRVDAADQELTDLADLVRRCVHKNYMLAVLVEQGVAFHYGNMPSLVRLEIERLFKAGKLKFLVCTSTLIEGVNLSCRTIVVRGPKKGKTTPMAAQDFWNLAGRAGRWGDEFQGNIVCIDAHDDQAWPHGVPQRTRYPIRRETDVALERIDELRQYIADRSGANIPDSNRVRAFEQVGSYLVATFVREGSLASAPWARRKPEKDIRDLEATLTTAASSMAVLPATGSRNPGVSLFGLERLLAFFRGYGGRVEDLLLAPSESDDAYDRFSAIMARINECVLPVFQPDTLIPLHAIIVLEWMKGFSLPTIIRRRIEYLQRRGETPDISKVIRDTLDLIETTARFLAPRYFSAYVDVLNQHLHEVGRDDLISRDLDIGVALEFGVTSITMRSLMELGVSRMSAVALYEIIALDDLDERACIVWVSNRRGQLDSMGLPNIVAREIREKVLSQAPAEE